MLSLVISGRIVPLSLDSEVASSEKDSFQGKVWIGDDGRVESITRRNAPGPKSGFDKAAVVDVGSNLVLPGFVDLHSHLAYATLPLWTEPGRTQPFPHHDSWPSAHSYAGDITWPAYALAEAAPHELLAYAEVRALIGGTTSIQGSPPRNRPLDSWMVRNVEDETFGGSVSTTRVLASTLTLKPEVLAARSAQMKAGAAFIYHCAEGQANSIVEREYQSARRCGCLQRGFIAIHTNAVNPDDYDAWTEPGTIVWSPFSNLWLYGSTTEVPSALARKIPVCIGSDWGPSGTRNVLGEIKVAALVSKSQGWKLTPFDLVRMITCVPGDALVRPWAVQAGRLQAEALGDVVVIQARPSAEPFGAVLAATENDVQLTVVGGRPLYGNPDLMKAATAKFSSTLNIAGAKRTLSMAKPTDQPEPWTMQEVLARMEQVRANPKEEINAARNAFAASRLTDATPRLRLALDMPLGRVPVGGLPKDLDEIVVPPIQPLHHDAAFFASIKGRGFHGGLLDSLAGFYS
jgi:cytosine/adenosine deaminase-related metal-dependent hydrolase